MVKRVSAVLRELVLPDADSIASLWQSATHRRRRETGLDVIEEASNVFSRPGVFAVGVVEGHELLSMALGLPALADDGRSEHNVPGLVHISSVATVPEQWGNGLARRCLHGVMCQATRRGYARAQLWTHLSNPGARRVYETAGFERSGRQKLDGNGESLVHYVRELPVLPRIARPAARLVCLDAQHRVLLLHWRDPFDGYQLWEPPGGGIEAGETPYDAVMREWREETGLPMPRLDDPSTLVGRDVIFNGRRCVVDEDFFLGRTAAAGAPKPDEATAEEQDAYLGHAWVPWDEIASLDDPAEPDLLPVLRRLRPDGPWAAAPA